MKTNWESFNPEVYVEDNYSYLHEEDRHIIDTLVPFYHSLPHIGLAAEIGCGPNIYPIELLLPYTDSIRCIEYSERNIEYLKKQLRSLDQNWMKFLDYMRSIDSHYNFDIAYHLNTTVTVERGDIYHLPVCAYDLVSMNFVAESITSSKEEFLRAWRGFIGSAKHGGYITATFMEGSVGYTIDGVHFPAYPVNKKTLMEICNNEMRTCTCKQIPRADTPLRDGYEGMIVLYGQKK
jgi:hypothetical protein